MSSMLLLPILVTSLGALVANPNTFLNLFAGRLSSHNDNTLWVNHGNLNNENCWAEPAGQACEDVRIHSPSGTAFLACGYPDTRAAFYPALGVLDPTSAKTYHEYFLKYDMKNNKTTKLQVNGIGEDHDLVLHGLDIWAPKETPSLIYLFAVNHKRDGEAITVFSHKLGTNSLDFVREYKHPQIRTPNAVAATGLNSFFITNDHHYYSGFLRTLEGKFGPWTWATDVVHCSSNGPNDLECKKVSPSQPGANGALLVDDGKTLLVNDFIEGSVSIFSVNQESKQLSLRQKIILGAHCDNLSEIPGTGDILVAIFPALEELIGRLTNPMNTTFTAKSAALKLVKSKGYAPELLFWNDGSLLSVLTGAVYDPETKRFIAGTVIDDHFLVCDIN